MIGDVQYVEDGERAHRLDLYLPHGSVVRAGKTTPVYIDIHGGGFVYGYKELNRNFCTHLAEQGFAVFSVNYRPAPETDFLGHLEDAVAAFRWIAVYRGDYSVARNQVFVAGDLTGGTLALYMTAIERSCEFADAIGVAQSGFELAGSALISPMPDIQPYLADRDAMTPESNESHPALIVDAIAPIFFQGFPRA